MTPPHDFVTPDKCKENQDMCQNGLASSRRLFITTLVIIFIAIIGTWWQTNANYIADSSTQKERIQGVLNKTIELEKIQENAQMDRSDIKRNLNAINTSQQVMQRDIKYLVEQEKKR